MKILIVHNYYQHPGGEDVVFDLESELLQTTQTVHRLTFKNKPGWRGFWQTLWSPWNIFAAAKLKKAIHAFQPDVIHFHNFHYALGPIGLRVAKNMQVPMVVTLHNYRIICPSATLFYKGKLFTDSLHRRFPWKAIRLGVHSHSSLKTAWLAFTNWFHKKIGTWNHPDRYIVLSDFAKQIFIRSTIGIPAQAFSIKPNFVTASSRENVPMRAPAKNRSFLYVGRLSEEKGIELLLQAFERNGLSIDIAGDGPLRSLVEKSCSRHPNIHYLGMISRKEIPVLMEACDALIFPSICYEGMPIAILEALASATVVIASNLGSLPSIITHQKNGLLFEPKNYTDLNQQIKDWLEMGDPDKQSLRLNAFESYQKLYTPQHNKAQLLSIYQEVIASATS